METASARRAALRFAWAPAALLLLELTGCHRRPAPTQLAPPPPLVEIAGRVLDGRAHPVPNARVAAFAVAGGAEPRQATAELDGSFRIAQLAPGAYRLLVEAAGFPAAETAPVAAPGDEIVLHVAGEGRSLLGQVTRDGAPAADAVVTLGAEAGGPVRETRSRADGRFAFGGLGDGRYAVRAARGDLVSATVRDVAVGADGASLPPLALAPGQGIAGRVVDDTGAGLAGVGVHAESAALAPGDDPLPGVARSDGTGAFRIGPLPGGGYRLTASRADHVLRAAPAVTLPAAAPTAPVLLELLRGARVVGRVTDAHGAAVESARVRCVASTMDDLTVQAGPLPLAAEAAALPSGAGRALGSTRTAIADARGRFTVDDLIPGRYRVEVAHLGLESTRSDELALAPGERRDLGTLVLQTGFPATGRVVDDSGVPIEAARVVVGDASGGGANTEAAGLYAVTDASGSFSIPLPAGRYRLTAGAAGYVAAHADVEARPGAPPPAVELRLTRAEAMLEGLVRDTGGRPLARARLLAWPRAGTAGTAEAPLASTTADVGGHFRLAELPAGDLQIEVQHPDYPQVTLPATPGQFASLTVPFPGGIAGEARARATGAVVPRGRVEASGPDGAKAIADIQRAGAFRLRRLVPGHWRLTVSAPGFHPAEKELDVPPSTSLGEPSVRDLRVDLEGG